MAEGCGSVSMVCQSKKKKTELQCIDQKNSLRKGVKVRLDPTKRTPALLSETNKVVVDNDQVKFFYANVNYRLKARWTDETNVGNFSPQWMN